MRISDWSSDVCSSDLMSRRREQGIQTTWADAFSVVRTPSFGAILVLGLLLTAIFLLWLVAAYAIYHFTLGPESPASIGAFVQDVFRSEEHTSELQPLMRSSYDVLRLQKTNRTT